MLNELGGAVKVSVAEIPAALLDHAGGWDGLREAVGSVSHHRSAQRRDSTHN